MFGKKKNDKYNNNNVVPTIPVSPLWTRRLWESVVRYSGSVGVKWALLILLPLIILAYNPTPRDDYDIWWHLALGQHYIQQQTMHVDHSVYSWTPAVTDWVYNTWLGSTVLYLVYRASGTIGFWILQWLIFLGVFTLMVAFWKTVYKKLDVLAVSGIFLIACAMGPGVSVYRPELFSTIFFTLYLFIYFYGKQTGRNCFWLFPLLFPLWVNLHGGFMFGLILLSLILAGETLDYFLFRQNPLPIKLFRMLWIAVPLCYLLILLNPYGIMYPLSILKWNNPITSEENYFGPAILAYKSLWPNLTNPFLAFIYTVTAWIQTLFAVLYLTLAVRLLIKNRFIDWTLLGINALFYVWGMSTARVMIFSLQVFFFSSVYLLARSDALQWRRRAAPFALAAFLFVAGCVGIYVLRHWNAYSWFGTRLIEMAPADEAQFIRKWKIPGPLFNDYGTGGYLLWSLYPEYKVFIDPRYGPYVTQVVPDYFMFIRNHSSEAIRWLTEKYPFKVAVINLDQLPLIFSFLRVGHGDWCLLYFEKNAVILVHHSLIPTLNPELRAVNLTPLRFSKVDDPVTLYKLFLLYVNLKPMYGRMIRDIYRTNVSSWYQDRELILDAMDETIREAEAGSGHAGGDSPPPPGR
jgi:hypothetical protein